MKVIKPPRLKAGDTVGIIAPSKAPYTRHQERINQGKDFLESIGLKVKMGNNLYKSHYFKGASIEERLEDIHDFYKDPEVKMIMMVCGGVGCDFMVHKLDYKLIEQNPKIFCGMSDGNSLAVPIFQKTGIITYYGIDLTGTLGNKINEVTKQNFIDTFFEGKPKILENRNMNFHKWDERMELPKYEGWQCIRKGKASGELMGGILHYLPDLSYSVFPIDYKNKILFFEGTKDLNHSMKNLLTLKNKGIFSEISGMIIGYFNSIKDQMTISDMIAELTKEYDFPIIQIGELGHCVENYSFPIGCKATIDTEKMSITIDEGTVS